MMPTKCEVVPGPGVRFYVEFYEVDRVPK